MSRSRRASPDRWLYVAVIVTAAVFVVPACQDEPNEDEDVARLAAMKQEILRLVDDLGCKAPADCVTIGLGVKPCGGPWEYLVYSSSSVDEDVLERMVMRYNEFNDVLNKRYGWTSTCDVAIRPVVSCVDGRCAVVPPESVPDLAPDRGRSR